MLEDQNDSTQNNPQVSDQPVESTITNDASSSATQDWQHPGEPIATSQPDSSAMPTTEPNTPADVPEPTSSASTDLSDIKRQALGELTPLIGKLDQSPEEKYRTLMMVIQGSDDQTLISQAYQAAQMITDEKARAQALLDIINEINYFSQQEKEKTVAA